MAMVVQEIATACLLIPKLKQSWLVGRCDVSETRRADTRMTSAEYDGDNPLRLANEIDAALQIRRRQRSPHAQGDPLF
jgi:hypothetical protein